MKSFSEKFNCHHRQVISGLFLASELKLKTLSILHIKKGNVFRYKTRHYFL